MAILGKKEKKSKKDVLKTAKDAPPKKYKPSVPPDIYTLFLGLAALFFIMAVLVLGLNYYWYQSVDPAVVPMNWAK
jgi:hypothetical protein